MCVSVIFYVKEVCASVLRVKEFCVTKLCVCVCGSVRTINIDVKILCTADDMAAVSLAMPTKPWDSAGRAVDVCASV